MCQEISDLHEGQLLALCQQPGVGAVIYLLFGAASAEVSMENTPGEQSAGAAEHRQEELGEEALQGSRFRRAHHMPMLRPPNPRGRLVQEPNRAPTEVQGESWAVRK